MLYTIKELKTKTNEELLFSLLIEFITTTKEARKNEDRIIKELSSRNIINYQTMRTMLDKL